MFDPAVPEYTRRLGGDAARNCDCKNRTQTWSVPIISNRITQSSYVTPRATAANPPSDETSGAAAPKGSGATSHFFASIVYASEDIKVICFTETQENIY